MNLPNNSLTTYFWPLLPAFFPKFLFSSIWWRLFLSHYSPSVVNFIHWPIFISNLNTVKALSPKPGVIHLSKIKILCRTLKSTCLKANSTILPPDFFISINGHPSLNFYRYNLIHPSSLPIVSTPYHVYLIPYPTGLSHSFFSTPFLLPLGLLRPPFNLIIQ